MGVKRLILARKYELRETRGLYIVMDDNEDIFKCVCLELPWLDNKPNLSCIPLGIYQVEKFSNIKHPNTFWIKDVPGRSGILMHKGTFANEKDFQQVEEVDRQIDTLGCQLPGLGFIDVDGNGTLDVTGSGIAMDALNYFLPQSFQIAII